MFIDPSVTAANLSLDPISSTAMVLPRPTEEPPPLPAELRRASVVNSLAFAEAFPETLREHLLVQWSEQTSMPERIIFSLISR